MTGEDNNTPRVKNVQLTPFFSEDPAYWFNLIERTFAVNGINDQQARFDIVIQVLPQHLQQEVKGTVNHVMQNIGQQDLKPYDMVKEKIISTTCIPEEARITQLLEKETIGSKTPSQFLEHLRNLLGENPTNENNVFIKNIFLKNLSPITRAIIAGQKIEDLTTIAQTADSIHKIMPTPGYINQVSTYNGDSNPNQFASNENNLAARISKISLKQDTDEEVQRDNSKKIKELEQRLMHQELEFSKKLLQQETEFTRKLQRLQNEMDQLRRTAQDNQARSQTQSGRQRGRSRSNSRASRPSNDAGRQSNDANSSTNDAPRLCYYHYRFGANSTRCTTPCSYEPEN